MEEKQWETNASYSILNYPLTSSKSAVRAAEPEQFADTCPSGDRQVLVLV